MSVTVSEVQKLEITKGSKWKSARGEMAVVINRYHDYDTKQATTFELYLWNEARFIIIEAEKFCEAIKSNHYTRIN